MTSGSPLCERGAGDPLVGRHPPAHQVGVGGGDPEHQLVGFVVEQQQRTGGGIGELGGAGEDQLQQLVGVVRGVELGGDLDEPLQPGGGLVGGFRHEASPWESLGHVALEEVGGEVALAEHRVAHHSLVELDGGLDAGPSMTNSPSARTHALDGLRRGRVPTR